MFNVNRACFPKEKHQNSQKWAKFMNFSFWLFLWFGLPGRLLRYVANSSEPKTRRAILGTLDAQTLEQASKNPLWFSEGS